MIMISELRKKNIIEKLNTIDFTKVNGYTLGIKLFLEDIEKRSDENYYDLIKCLTDYCDSNPDAAIEALGVEVYDFFTFITVFE